MLFNNLLRINTLKNKNNLKTKLNMHTERYNRRCGTDEHYSIVGIFQPRVLIIKKGSYIRKKCDIGHLMFSYYKLGTYDFQKKSTYRHMDMV